VNSYQIIKPFENIIERYKINKEQKNLNRYVNIHDYLGNANDDIYNARKVLANYARTKGVSIDIFTASKKTEEELANNTKNQLDNHVSVIVKDLLTGKVTQRIIDADVNKTHNVQKKIGYGYIENHADGTERVVPFKGEYEDNFLRHLYRNITEMVDSHFSKKK
jgi:hypothetical protein